MARRVLSKKVIRAFQVVILHFNLVRWAGLWPHAYFRHILEPEGENQVQPTSTSRRNSLQNGSFHSPDVVEMRSTGQALDSMEAGRREQ
ncbi:hypothetical protein BAE44_0001140 [Dichanthelium oligosanthes]|uniref:Uncharacterized protein n=1 Tax=Dichanthelium oligosanthes TaxID=888268 RepID=A0A1E5WKB2_9POAL|nr:hypothetical protein BAE44_0001140 [Dichanthelium oligosanthes]